MIYNYSFLLLRLCDTHDISLFLLQNITKRVVALESELKSNENLMFFFILKIFTNIYFSSCVIHDKHTHFFFKLKY